MSAALTKVETRSIAPAPEQVSAQVMEKVLASGDLSQLTPQQRVEYYNSVCRTMDLNPLTRPFDFMVFQGKTVMYAKRDCADQLRSKRNISLKVINQQIEAGLFIVTVRATTPSGREDEDMGAVQLPASGEPRANAILKAITKAKRRVTLSICGLGFMDESEVETLIPQGAKVMDYVPQEPARIQQKAEVPTLDEPQQETARKPTVAEFLDGLQRDFDAAIVQGREAVDRLLTSEPVQKALDRFIKGNKERLERMIKDALDRTLDDVFPGDRDAA